MLSPYDWWLTGKILFHLARFYPDLKNPRAPAYPLPPCLEPWAAKGPHQTRVVETEWGRATVPIGAERPVPVLLFSGGAAADGTYYPALVGHWASHGFAVLEPLHADAFIRHLDRGGGGFWTWQGVVWDAWGLALREPSAWKGRVADLKGLLDRLDTVGDQVGVGLDEAKVGAVGYSYGAQAALLLGGSGFVHHGKLSNWRDPRVRAALAISPEFGGRTAPRSAERGLSIPALFLTGDQDRDVQGRDWQAKAKSFERAPAGDKWLAVLRGANHFAFTGRLFEAARQPADLAAQGALFGAAKGISAAFFSAYLCRDEAGLQAMRELEASRQRLVRVWGK